MTGRANTKLAWTVALGVLWAWFVLLLALGAPEREPLFELGLKPGEEGTFVPGRLAELIEDQSGIRIKMDWVAPPDKREMTQPPDLPKLPDGITLDYIPPAENPLPPRIEVVSGVGPIRLPSGATLVAARDYIFKVEHDGLRIVKAAPGSPLRRRLEWMEREHRRHPFRDERREKFRERPQDRRGPFGGPRGGQGGSGGPEGPPPEGGPPPDSNGPGGPPPPPDGGERRGPPPGDQRGPGGQPGQGGGPGQRPGGPGDRGDNPPPQRPR